MRIVLLVIKSWYSSALYNALCNVDSCPVVDHLHGLIVSPQQAILVSFSLLLAVILVVAFHDVKLK